MWALVGPATVLGLADGLSMPSAQAGATGAVPDLAGATQAVGVLQNGTPYPVAGIMVLGVGARARVGRLCVLPRHPAPSLALSEEL